MKGLANILGDKPAEKLLSLADKKIPGFGLAFLLASLAYMYVKPDHAKLSAVETLATAFVCWLLYNLASYLDNLYDLAYKPKTRLGFLPGNDALKEARDHAAAALFGPVDARVVDYASAVAQNRIGNPRPSLYGLCSKVAKPTVYWRDTIEPTIDVSKAARTVFAFAVVILITKMSPLGDSLGMATYIEKLGILAKAWVLCVIAVAAFLVYVALRVRHNVQLYETVATDVKHLTIGTDLMAAVIFEVPLKKGQSDKIQQLPPGNVIVSART